MGIHDIIQAEVALFKGPLNDFLTKLQQPAVNVQAVVQDYVRLQLVALSQAPQAQSVAINKLAAMAQEALNASPAVSAAGVAAIAALPSEQAQADVKP